LYFSEFTLEFNLCAGIFQWYVTGDVTVDGKTLVVTSSISRSCRLNLSYLLEDIIARLIVFSPQPDYKNSKAFQTDYIVVSKAHIAVSNKNTWFNHVRFGSWSRRLTVEAAGIGHYEDPPQELHETLSRLLFSPAASPPLKLHDGRGERDHQRGGIGRLPPGTQGGTGCRRGHYVRNPFCRRGSKIIGDEKIVSKFVSLM
jgi:hypothetical protein